MAITFNILTSGTGGAGNQTTASVAPGANKLILVVVTTRQNSGIDTLNNVTVTGNGLTYVQIAETNLATSARQIAVFRAMGASPSSGTISLVWGGTFGTLGWSWEVVEWSGVNTTGTNGSGAVGSAGTNFDDATGTITVTIPGTPAIGDVTYAVGMTEDTPTDMAPEAGWADVIHVTGGPETQHYSIYDVDQDQTASWTWTPATTTSAAAGLIIRAPGVTSSLFGDDDSWIPQVELPGYPIIRY